MKTHEKKTPLSLAPAPPNTRASQALVEERWSRMSKISEKYFTDRYKPFFQSVEDVAKVVQPPLTLNEDRLVFPNGETPSMVDLAFEAIRRGFRGEEAEVLMWEMARRKWIFWEVERDEQEVLQQGRELHPEYSVEAFFHYSWKDIPRAAFAVLEAASYADLLDECAAKWPEDQDMQAARRKHGRA
jgi:hypothetical protein